MKEFVKLIHWVNDKGFDCIGILLSQSGIYTKWEL